MIVMKSVQRTGACSAHGEKLRVGAPAPLRCGWLIMPYYLAAKSWG